MSVPIPAWVQSRAIPAFTASEIRQAVANDLMSVVGAEVALYYHVAMLDGQPWYTDVVPYSTVHDMELFRECAGTKVVEWADINASVLTQLNAFCVTHREAIESNLMYPRLWKPLDLRSVVAMAAVVDGQMVGWIGAYRVGDQEPFADSIVKALAPRVDAYVHALEVARELEGHPRGDRGSVLLEQDGTVSFRSQGAESWLDDKDFAAELTALVRDSDELPLGPKHIGGAIVRLTTVSGERELVLAEILPTSLWQPGALAYLGVQKRRVAEYAAAGLTNAEIAFALGVSAETVRTHMKQIYEKLNIYTRLELAEYVREISR